MFFKCLHRCCSTESGGKLREDLSIVRYRDKNGHTLSNIKNNPLCIRTIEKNRCIDKNNATMPVLL